MFYAFFVGFGLFVTIYFMKCTMAQGWRLFRNNKVMTSSLYVMHFKGNMFQGATNPLSSIAGHGFNTHP